MNEQEWIQKLKQEGFTDVRVCPLPGTIDTPAHTHDEHTVHIILNGELTITDKQGAKTYKPGDRVEFPPGTEHKAKSNSNEGTMIIGVKK